MGAKESRQKQKPERGLHSNIYTLNCVWIKVHGGNEGKGTKGEGEGRRVGKKEAPLVCLEGAVYPFKSLPSKSFFPLRLVFKNGNYIPSSASIQTKVLEEKRQMELHKDKQELTQNAVCKQSH